MDRLRKFFSGISDRTWVSVAGVAALAAVAVGGLYWARGGQSTQQSVEEKWNVALRELGVEPVYPPEEDIEVGDVFAIVSSDSIPENGVTDSPLANHAIRLWRLDLSKDVDSNYKNIYVFPETPRKRDPGVVTAASQTVASSIFALADHRSDLPIVTFPRFRLSDNRSARFGFVGSFLSGLTGSAAANSDFETEVSITRTQTYGVPYLVAENALVKFCEDDFPPACEDLALREVLSTRIGPQIFDVVENKRTGVKQWRMAVEVGLINRVFLTRAIETRLMRAQSLTGRATANAGVAPKPGDASVPAKPAIPSPEGTGAKTVQGDEPPTDDIGLADSGGASQRSELAISFDGKILERPVVFGFESARYHRAPSPIPKDDTDAQGKDATAKK
jgi:hypothetical protein